MAFGGIAVDQVGPTRDFPAASMLTGLFANALGWRWPDRKAHQALQDRLIFAARSERAADASPVLTDTQNARLDKADEAWTTSGTPMGRAGASYRAPHRRARDYLADRAVQIVLRLQPAGREPTLARLAEALDRPARPLFIGRKPCLPSCRLMNGWVRAGTAHAALSLLPGPGPFQALWPVGEGPDAGAPAGQVADLADLRNWHTGLHGGWRRVVEGRIEGVGQP